MKSVLLSALCLLLVAGCSSTHTQQGVDLTKEGSFITISTDSEKNNRILTGLDKRIVITSLNDKSLFRVGWDSHYPDVVHVKDGVQTIEVRFNYKNSYANGCVWVDAKFGENYIIKQAMDGYSIIFWVENTQTGEKVGGICGSEPTSKNS
ncbi:hypothetical protein [Pseudoalteromonas ardens]|uniref:Lipoprotein n=1 Tax=Pseudoalteromonas rubra TaxID=43658 RepID=A0A0L0EUH5_9GAMM|nr:hypothetical protein [Pseudoalteromonas sp. R96]KNC68045.1 hypothetical protein AC626_07235 [Pseudoalteromonas rubra]MDK1310523.1 hypothetical protein [Pseudoalteromonas sp. R96]